MSDTKIKEKEDPTDKIDKEADRLIDKINEDFRKHVAKGNLSEILIKGHLLVEHYMDHVMLLIFDKKANVRKKSFYTKVKELGKTDCFADKEATIGSLYSLNEVRNELAHQLDFKVTFSQVETIGYNFGKKFVLERYAKGTDEKSLLLWALNRIMIRVTFPIWDALSKELEKKSK